MIAVNHTPMKMVEAGITLSHSMMDSSATRQGEKSANISTIEHSREIYENNRSTDMIVPLLKESRISNYRIPTSDNISMDAHLGTTSLEAGQIRQSGNFTKNIDAVIIKNQRSSEVRKTISSSSVNQDKQHDQQKKEEKK